MSCFASDSLYGPLDSLASTFEDVDEEMWAPLSPISPVSSMKTFESYDASSTPAVVPAAFQLAAPTTAASPPFAVTKSEEAQSSTHVTPLTPPQWPRAESSPNPAAPASRRSCVTCSMSLAECNTYVAIYRCTVCGSEYRTKSETVSNGTVAPTVSSSSSSRTSVKPESPVVPVSPSVSAGETATPPPMPLPQTARRPTRAPTMLSQMVSFPGLEVEKPSCSNCGKSFKNVSGMRSHQYWCTVRTAGAANPLGRRPVPLSKRKAVQEMAASPATPMMHAQYMGHPHTWSSPLGAVPCMGTPGALNTVNALMAAAAATPAERRTPADPIQELQNMYRRITSLYDIGAQLQALHSVHSATVHNFLSAAAPQALAVPQSRANIWTPAAAATLGMRRSGSFAQQAAPSLMPRGIPTKTPVTLPIPTTSSLQQQSLAATPAAAAVATPAAPMTPNPAAVAAPSAASL